MLRWLIDKKIRVELDDCYSKIAKMEAKVEILETHVLSLRNLVNASKYKKKDEREESAEPEVTIEEIMKLTGGQVPMELMEKFNSSQGK